jgi:alginate O-acetyltransferase complex protein AlgJ
MSLPSTQSVIGQTQSATVKPAPVNKASEYTSNAHRFNGVFMIASVIVGATFAVMAHPWTADLSGKSITDGAASHALEAELDKNIPVRQPSIDAWGVLEYNLFKNGRTGVLVGQDGWLFTDEEFKRPEHFDAEIQGKLEYISEVKRKLEANGTQLAVVVIPAKARIHNFWLGRYKRPAYWENVYSSFLKSLKQRGVITPDPLSAMINFEINGGPQYFLKTDTHFTPEGAQVIAASVAEAIKAASLSLTPATFTEVPGKPVEHSGDLLKYIPMGSMQASGPKSDVLLSSTVEGSSGGGLLGDAKLEVALVGTSYSANEKFGFPGSLKLELGADLLNAAQEGKGPIVPMREYMKTFKENPVKLVIWEIPERFLPVAYPETPATK